MRVAIVHYWLVGMRGGEKVVEALCRLFPDADLFTHVYVPGSVSKIIAEMRIHTSFIARLPGAGKRYKSYLPLMPMALEQLDLRQYDLIISSESGPSKGIIPPADSLHICYCHSPMRYIWNMFHDYRDKSGFLTRKLMPLLSHYVRTWDAVSATRVHHFVANSKTVARRLQTYYRRDADVIYPPVDVDQFYCAPSADVDDYYLMVGELVQYKRPDLVIEAFNRSGLKLVVVGGGEMLAAIRARARPNIRVLGPQPFDRLREYYAHCRALVFPGEEDFGIVPVEAMASGRPVIAFNRGGATETVIDGITGTMFDHQTVEAVIEACDKNARTTFDPSAIRRHACMFSRHHFERQMKTLIENKLAVHRSEAAGYPLAPDLQLAEL